MLPGVKARKSRLAQGERSPAILVPSDDVNRRAGLAPAPARLYCNTVNSCLFDKNFHAESKAERRSASYAAPYVATYVATYVAPTLRSARADLKVSATIWLRLRRAALPATRFPRQHDPTDETTGSAGVPNVLARNGRGHGPDNGVLKILGTLAVRPEKGLTRLGRFQA